MRPSDKGECPLPAQVQSLPPLLPFPSSSFPLSSFMKRILLLSNYLMPSTVLCLTV